MNAHVNFRYVGVTYDSHMYRSHICNLNMWIYIQSTITCSDRFIKHGEHGLNISGVTYVAFLQYTI